MSISGGRISVITYRTTAVDLDSYPMSSLKLDAPNYLEVRYRAWRAARRWYCRNCQKASRSCAHICWNDCDL